jgi:uncharacterized membrane protein YeiB
MYLMHQSCYNSETAWDISRNILGLQVFGVHAMRHATNIWAVDILTVYAVQILYQLP